MHTYWLHYPPDIKRNCQQTLSNLFVDPFTLHNMAPQGTQQAFKANYRLVSHTTKIYPGTSNINAYKQFSIYTCQAFISTIHSAPIHTLINIHGRLSKGFNIYLILMKVIPYSTSSVESGKVVNKEIKFVARSNTWTIILYCPLPLYRKH